MALFLGFGKCIFLSLFGGTLCDINFLCPETRVMLKLGRKAMGHFVMIIEIHVHLIRGLSENIMLCFPSKNTITATAARLKSHRQNLHKSQLLLGLAQKTMDQNNQPINDEILPLKTIGLRPQGIQRSVVKVLSPQILQSQRVMSTSDSALR